MNLGTRIPVDRTGPSGLPRYRRAPPGPPGRRTIEIPLAARVAGLEEEVAGISRTLGDLIGRLDDVAGRLEALEVTVHEIPPPPPPTPPPPPPPVWPDPSHCPAHHSPDNRHQIIQQLTSALRYLQHEGCDSESDCYSDSDEETASEYIADYNCGSLSCKSRSNTDQTSQSTTCSIYGDSSRTGTDILQRTAGNSQSVSLAPPIVLLDSGAPLPCDCQSD